MASRNQCLEEAHELQSLIHIPTFVTSMGKGSANEELSNYGGVYGGAGTHPEVKKAVESTDCVLWIGRYGSDFNTGEFTMAIAEDKIIDLQRFFLTVGGKKVDLKMKHLLRALIAEVKQKPLSAKFAVTWDPYPLRNLPATGNLTQDFLWNAMSKFFQPGDVIIGETGMLRSVLRNEESHRLIVIKEPQHSVWATPSCPRAPFSSTSPSGEA